MRWGETRFLAVDVLDTEDMPISIALLRTLLTLAELLKLHLVTYRVQGLQALVPGIAFQFS